MKAFAMLTAAVVVAIAIGVSLVSGLPAAPALRFYGSPPLRFEAAFPSALGQPVIHEPGSGFGLLPRNNQIRLAMALPCPDVRGRLRSGCNDVHVVSLEAGVLPLEGRKEVLTVHQVQRSRRVSNEFRDSCIRTNASMC
jgi:hypothetical protein